MHMSLVTPTNVILVKHWGVGNGFLEWLQQWRGEELEIIRKDNSFEVFLLEKKTEK